MAADFISGWTGGVTMAGHGGIATAWTLTVTPQTKDVSGYGGGRFTKNRAGMIGWNGSVNVLLQYDAASTAPDVVTIPVDGESITLTATTGCTFVGDVIFGFNINHAVTDPAVGATYNYTGADTLAETWDESGT